VASKTTGFILERSGNEVQGMIAVLAGAGSAGYRCRSRAGDQTAVHAPPTESWLHLPNKRQTDVSRFIPTFTPINQGERKARGTRIFPLKWMLLDTWPSRNQTASQTDSSPIDVGAISLINSDDTKMVFQKKHHQEEVHNEQTQRKTLHCRDCGYD